DPERMRRGDLERVGRAGLILQHQGEERLVGGHEGARDGAVVLLAGLVVARPDQIAGLEVLDRNQPCWRVDGRPGREAGAARRLALAILAALPGRGRLPRLARLLLRLRRLARVLLRLLGPPEVEQLVDQLDDLARLGDELETEPEELAGREVEGGHETGHE